MTATFEDERDGEVYRTIFIGDVEWMRENLRLETEWSFSSKKPEAGGYYALCERDHVCPSGWAIPSTEQWHDMLHEVFGHPNWSKDTLQMSIDSSLYAGSDPSGPRMEHFIPSTEGLFRDTLINLRPYGWKEGPWIKNKKTLSVWVNRPGYDDPKFHIHQSDGAYIHHTHAHHLADGIGKPRRFNARCVRTMDK